MSYLSTNSSTSYTTASASKRMSGLMSGLDTDEIVKQMTIGLQNKIDSQLQKKQVASWQQDAYRTITKAITEFQSKYFNSTTSSNSILSANFFSSTSIANTSPYLNISGSASAASKMQLKGITQLAKQASFASTQKVSNETIQSGTIQSSWVKSSITNSSMKINFEGKDYTLNIGRDGQTKTLDDISTQINTQLKDLGLSDKIQFDKASGESTFSFKSIGESATSEITIQSGSENLLTGLGLKAGDKGTALAGTGVNEDYFSNHSIAAGSKLVFKIGGEEHTLTLASSVEMPLNDDAGFTKKLETVLQDALKANTTLKDKLNISVTESGVSFSAKDGSNIEVTADSSKNLLNGLSLTAGTSAASIGGSVQKEALYTTHLDESLAGSSITFDLNGLSKTIQFDETLKSQYDTPAKLQEYLNTKLKAAYGDGKISVSLTDNKLSFKTATGNSTDVLTLQSSSKTGVLGVDGAFGMYAGESNRINLNKSLRDVQSNLQTTLSEPTDGLYKINVNGKDFEFKATDNIDSIMKKINNDADANITISYSSTLNTFSAVAKNGGESSKVEIKDVSGNLGAVLFGSDTQRNIQSGQDAQMEVSFDNGNTFHSITRSSNKFTLDGVDFELLKSSYTQQTEVDSEGNTVTKTVNGIDTPVTFQIENKTDDLMKKITQFVEDYNNVLTLVNDPLYQQKPTDGKYPPLTDEQRAEMSETQIKNWEDKAKQGLLLNDSLLASFSQEWQKAMTNQVSSISTALYEIGINSQSYKDRGKLTIDEDALKRALTDDPEKVASLFTGTDGIATRLQTTMTKYTNDSLVNTGLFITKAGSSSSTVDQSELAKSMKEYDTQVKALKVRLSSQQELYYSKFTALEKYISQMNSQASFFTQSGSTY